MGRLITEAVFEHVGRSGAVSVRIYKPVRCAAGRWSCRIQADAPFAIDEDAVGASSLEALALAMRRVSQAVYANRDFREGRLQQVEREAGWFDLPPPSELASPTNMF